MQNQVLCCPHGTILVTLLLFCIVNSQETGALYLHIPHSSLWTVSSCRRPSPHRHEIWQLCSGTSQRTIAWCKVVRGCAGDCRSTGQRGTASCIQIHSAYSSLEVGLGSVHDYYHVFCRVVPAPVGRGEVSGLLLTLNVSAFRGFRRGTLNKVPGFKALPSSTKHANSSWAACSISWCGN